ncbi:MAG: T9SS type A sorting domain-containing protein [Bacteroidales bacterium]|jgi:hypothetical protein
MKKLIFTSTMLLAAIGAFAQINAGQNPQILLSGIQAAVYYPPINQVKFDSVDINNDGVNDLVLAAGGIVYDGEEYSTYPFLLNQNIQICTDNKGVKKYNLGNQISATGNWTSLVGGPNGIYFRSIRTSSWNGPPYPPYTYSGNWYDYTIDGSGIKWPDCGYLGFRIINPLDTLYGWMKICSMTDPSFCSSVSCTEMGLESPQTHINQNYKKPLVSVYPNPAMELITIEIKNKERLGYIEIIDITGKAILRRDCNYATDKVIIDVGNFAKGMYIVKLYNKENFRIEKLIIE